MSGRQKKQKKEIKRNKKEIKRNTQKEKQNKEGDEILVKKVTPQFKQHGVT